MEHPKRKITYFHDGVYPTEKISTKTEKTSLKSTKAGHGRNTQKGHFVKDNKPQVIPRKTYISNLYFYSVFSGKKSHIADRSIKKMEKLGHQGKKSGTEPSTN